MTPVTAVRAPRTEKRCRATALPTQKLVVDGFWWNEGLVSPQDTYEAGPNGNEVLAPNPGTNILTTNHIAWPVLSVCMTIDIYILLLVVLGIIGMSRNALRDVVYTNKRVKNNDTRTRTVWCMMWCGTDMATGPRSLQGKASPGGYIIDSNYTNRNGSCHTSCDAQLQTRT